MSSGVLSAANVSANVRAASAARAAASAGTALRIVMSSMVRIVPTRPATRHGGTASVTTAT